MSGTSFDTNGPAPTRPHRAARAWTIGLGAAAALSVGGYALAMGGGMGGFHHHWDPAKKLEHMQAFSRRVLDGVGASTDQENRIHDIIAAAFTAVNKDRKPPEELRRRLIELMKAPSVDRAAVESLRAEMVASIDARSKVVANAVVDASGQLSAEQRGQLADRLAMMMDRRHGFGGWHRPWGDGGPRGEGGPRPDGPRGDRPDAN